MRGYRITFQQSPTHMIDSCGGTVGAIWLADSRSTWLWLPQNHQAHEKVLSNAPDARSLWISGAG